jgi:hypothetical protein
MTRAKTAFAALLVLLAGAGGAYWYLHRPVQQTSYYGVALSDGKSEVQYKLSVPPRVVAKPEMNPNDEWSRFPSVYDVDGDPATDKSALPRGQNFSSFDTWSYAVPSDPGGHLDVAFDPETKKVREVACYSSTVQPGSCNSAAGINIGDSEDRVRSALGQPSSENLSGVAKALTYDKLNIRLYLTKQKVYMINVGVY